MVLLDQARQDYILDVCISVKTNPKSDRYKNTILPPLDRPDLPKLFLWCPVTQYGCRVVCLKHHSVVRVGEWLDNVTKRCNRNPRLAFDLFENIVFVQRQYSCSSGMRCGNFLSNDIDVMEQLPKEIQARFPFRKYHLSIYTHDIIDYMFEQILRGLAITKISDSIVNLRASKYARKEIAASGRLENFCDDEIYSFPSKSNLRNIIVDEFKRTEHFYKSAMASLETGNCVSVYKISKNSGDLSFGASKFYLKDRQIFTILNEQNQILCWKLCHEITPDVIVEVLDVFSKRPNASSIKTILIENCCQEKDLYKTFFPNAEVKMTIFNAVKQVTQHIPNPQSFTTLSLVKKLGQVFRSTSDVGKVQQENSPQPEKIIENLSEFIDSEKRMLESLPEESRTLIDEALRSLIVHIQNGCLSDIKPGFATEPCEKLHRQLKKSVLTDAITPAVEFIEAVLTISFHHYNEKKKDIRHICSKEVVVYPARQLFSPDHTADIKASIIIFLQSSNLSSVNPDRITVSEFLWKKTFYLMQTVFLFKKKFRMVDIVNLMLLKELGFDFPEGDGLTDLEITLEEPTMNKSLETLIKSVLDQLQCHGLVDIQSKFDIVPESDESDAATVDKFLEHIVTACQQWEISFDPHEIDLKEDSIRHFLCEVIVEMISIPMALIYVEQVGNLSMLIPDLPVVHDTILVIGYKSSNGLFYSTIPEIASTPSLAAISDSLKKQCRCGWKGTTATCCTADSACSCIAEKRGCIECRCNIVRCQNRLPQEDVVLKATKHRNDLIVCRCSKGDKCCSGKRCPCFNVNQGCVSKCECCGGKCNNVFGKNTADLREKILGVPDQKKSRKRRRDTILTRGGSKLPRNDERDDEGEPIWKEYDVAAMVVCLQTLKKTQIEISSCNVEQLYKLLVDDHFLHIGNKSLEQIQEKLTVLQIVYEQDDTLEITSEEVEVPKVHEEVLSQAEENNVPPQVHEEVFSQTEEKLVPQVHQEEVFSQAEEKVALQVHEEIFSQTEERVALQVHEEVFSQAEENTVPQANEIIVVDTTLEKTT